MLNGLATSPLARAAATGVFGTLCFCSIIGLGLYRAPSVDGLIYGTYLAVASGVLWYGASSVPLIWPQNLLFATILNTGAAVAAAGSASFLVPYDQLARVRGAFGL